VKNNILWWVGNVSVFLDDFKTIYVASLATFMLNIIHPQTLWGILDITVTYSCIFCANLVKTDVFYERTSTSYDTEVVGTHDTEVVGALRYWGLVGTHDTEVVGAVTLRYWGHRHPTTLKSSVPTTLKSSVLYDTEDIKRNILVFETLRSCAASLSLEDETGSSGWLKPWTNRPILPLR